MAKLQWDRTGERVYETGVDRGVLYIPNSQGNYTNGYAWNGLTAVTESPSGAESSPMYADNMKYLNLKSVEEFGGTIEAFTYPDEFGQCDGSAQPVAGVYIGQQRRKTFGLSYRTLKGNDVDGTDHGYKIHLVYGADANPSERAYATVNDSPEAITFSWEFMTTAVQVGEIAGVTYKPTASITIDSTEVDAAALAQLESALYGTTGTDPRLPTPAEVFAFFAGTVTEVTPTTPTYDATTDTVTIPNIAGVIYSINGEDVTGAIVITENTLVNARPAAGFRFPDVVDDEFVITYV